MAEKFGRVGGGSNKQKQKCMLTNRNGMQNGWEGPNFRVWAFKV